MQRPAAYGFRLAPELHRLLRGRPPREALEWVLEVAGARRVSRVRPLSGGMSSAVHLVSLEGRAGAEHVVVLRRYVLDWVFDEPDAPANEAEVLALLDDTRVPAPRLIAADHDGRLTGVPMLLMSALPGRVRWDVVDVRRRLQRLAETMSEIHAVPPAPGLREFAPYEPQRLLVPPPWTRHPHAWQRALEVYRGPAPRTDRVFLHRDFHPGNVLWSRDQVSGIVDWVSGCAGPAEADVAHCRYNVAVHARQPDAADRFLAIWQAITGHRDYDPYWDLVTVVSVVTSEPDPALDEFVRSAAARLA